jgi:hypothetical protein
MQAPGQAVIKLSHRHHAIMEFMIANPEAPNSEVAKFFQVTEPWLSSLIHSELFQLELRYKQDVVFSEVATSVKDRITNLAHTSLQRLQERIDLGAVQTDTLVDISELALKSLGFGAPKVSAMQPAAPVFNQQINNFGSAPIDAKLLADARDRMLRSQPLLTLVEGSNGTRATDSSEVPCDVQRDGDPHHHSGAQVSEHAPAPT